MHAKIYCYNENEATYWIIGSSNATNNGCNIFGNSCNMEFNIGFRTSKEDYENFKKLLDGQCFKSHNIVDYRSYKKDNEGKVFNVREIYNDFLKNIKIQCDKAGDEDKPYKCKIEWFGKKFNDCEIGAKLPDDTEYSLFKDDGEYIFESKVPMSLIGIGIVEKEDRELIREFGLSIYKDWGDEAKGILDSKCDVSYTHLLEHIQKQILAGKSRKSISLRQNEGNGNVDSKGRRVNKERNINKIYSYENLLKLSQNKENEDDFYNALNQVLELTKQILVNDSNNVRQKHMENLIVELKKNMKDGKNYE